MVAGIPYFPLETVMNDRMRLIEAEFGLTGFGVAVRLWQKIYQSGYYVEWNDEVALLFAKEVGLGGSVVSEIVSALIKRRVFDQALYEKYGVLTSEGVQKRYFEIVKRRKSVWVRKELLLVSVTLLSENVNIIDENVCRNAKNVCNSEQRKEKESKEKKSKGDSPPRHKYGKYSNVLLSDSDIAALKSEFPGDWEERLERLSEYMESSGKTYKNHLATIRAWNRRDKARKDSGAKFDDRTYTREELDAKIKDPLAAIYATMEEDNL